MASRRLRYYMLLAMDNYNDSVLSFRSRDKDLVCQWSLYGSIQLSISIYSTVYTFHLRDWCSSDISRMFLSTNHTTSFIKLCKVSHHAFARTICYSRMC